jgi:hypothetical protein
VKREYGFDERQNRNAYILSAFWIVDNRWAIAIVVLPFAAWSRAAWTTFSELESRADVASSRRRTFGLRSNARAIAMRSGRFQGKSFLMYPISLTFLTSWQLRTFSTDLSVKTARWWC